MFILGHSMGALVATVAAEACQAHPTVGPRFKKLALSGPAMLQYVRCRQLLLLLLLLFCC